MNVDPNAETGEEWSSEIDRALRRRRAFLEGECPASAPCVPVVVENGAARIGDLELADVIGRLSAAALHPGLTFTPPHRTDPEDDPEAQHRAAALAHARARQERITGTTSLDALEILVLLEQIRKAKAALAALELPAVTALAELTRQDAAGLTVAKAERRVKAEVALATQVAPAQAAREVPVAQQVSRHLPAVHTLLATGRISLENARAIGERTATLDPADLAVADAAILERLPELQALGSSSWRREISALVGRIVPGTRNAHHRRAKARRYLAVHNGVDGMADLHLHIPAWDAAAIRLVARTSIRARSRCG
jgi:hypothetical protein